MSISYLTAVQGAKAYIEGLQRIAHGQAPGNPAEAADFFQWFGELYPGREVSSCHGCPDCVTPQRGQKSLLRPPPMPSHQQQGRPVPPASEWRSAVLQRARVQSRDDGAGDLLPEPVGHSRWGPVC